MNEAKSRFGKTLCVATVLVILAGLAITLFKERFVEWTGLDSGYMIAARYLSVMGIWLLWIVWALVFSGWKTIFRFAFAGTMMAVPVIFFSLFAIRFRGDVAIDGLDYRYAKPVALTDIDSMKSQPIRLDEKLADSFPGFFGVDRDGVVDGPGLNPDWESSPPIQIWKQSIGTGWSGAAIAGEYLVTMEQRGNDECVTCYRVDNGEPVWAWKHEARFEDFTGMGYFGPRSTPQIFDGNVYAQGGAGHLIAIDGATGDEIWKIDLCELLKIERTTGTNRRGFNYTAEPGLSWGRSASPVVTDELVIVPGGVGATLIAFDRATGKEVWRGGTEMIAYGSPRLATIAGRSQVLLQAENKAIGFDAATGEQLWEHDRPGNSAGDANCSQVTVVDDKRVIFSKGYLAGGEMVEIVEAGGKFAVESIWKNPSVLRTKLTNPVIQEGHAYSISEGFLECTRLSDGQRVWKRRGPYGDGQLLLVGDWLVIHGEKGQLQLVRASPEKEPDANEPVDTIKGICWNTIAITGDRLILRSDTEIGCWRLPVLAGESTATESVR